MKSKPSQLIIHLSFAAFKLTYLSRKRKEKKKQFNFVIMFGFKHFNLSVSVCRSCSVVTASPTRPLKFEYVFHLRFCCKGIFISLQFNVRAQTKLSQPKIHNANEKNKI